MHFMMYTYFVVSCSPPLPAQQLVEYMFFSTKWFAFSHMAVLNSCFEFSFVVMHFCVVTKSPYIGKEFCI